MPSQSIIDQILGLNGHPDPVAAVVARLVLPSGVEREDLFQHCRLRLAKVLDRYSPEKGKPFSFAFCIAQKEAWTFLRTHRRHAKRFQPLPRQVDVAEDQIDHTERERIFAEVRDAVSQMPDDMREVIKSVCIEARPRILIAQKLGITTQELNAMVVLARAMLKRILTPKPVETVTEEPEPNSTPEAQPIAEAETLAMAS